MWLDTEIWNEGAFVACPYCRKATVDQSDLHGEDRDHFPLLCEHCERTFDVQRVQTVTYVSRPLREEGT